MHILIISWNFPPRRGGIEDVIAHVYSGLKKTHSVQLITTYAKSDSIEKDVFRAPVPGLIAFALYALWRGALLLFRDRRIEIVFGGSFLVAPLVLILARLFGRCAAVQAHGLDLVYPSTLYQTLCARWGKFLDRIVANSNYTAAIAEEKGFSPNLVSVISPGVDPDRFDAPEQFGPDGERKTILFVGRLARRKGVREFVRHSLTEIVCKVPQANFIIAGANPAESLAHGDDETSEINALVLELGLQQHVQLMGGVDDDELVRLYRSCDVVILPALRAPNDVEGFGIVLLEAAAAGKPTVATRVGGIPDAVDDGKSGILVEPGDYQSLSRTIIGLLNDPAAGLAMGRYGRQRVREQFAWDKIIERYDAEFTASTQSVFNKPASIPQSN